MNAIYSLGGGHTHTDVVDKSNLRNQARTGLRLVHACFNNLHVIILKTNLEWHENDERVSIAFYITVAS